MAIRVSAAKSIDALITNLGSRDAVTRDAAVARLIVIGARAVDRLLVAAASETGAVVRVAAWRALDAIGDARALEPALRALDDRDVTVAVAAAELTRRFVRGAGGAVVVDRLSAVVLDRQRDDTVRAAALQALGDLEPATIAPLRQALAGDPDGTPRRETSAVGSRPLGSRPLGSRPLSRRAATAPSTRLVDAADRGLPRDPAALRADIAAAGSDAPLDLLARLIDRIREREGAEAAAIRPAWTLARAAAHLALARRGSRLAHYDLKETLESARGPLPVEMLQALVLVGDATALESIAAAHARAQDPWSRRHLAESFYAIVDRERLTARSAVLRRLAKKSPTLTRASSRPRKSGDGSGGPGGSSGSD